MKLLICSLCAFLFLFLFCFVFFVGIILDEGSLISNQRMKKYKGRSKKNRSHPNLEKENDSYKKSYRRTSRKKFLKKGRTLLRFDNFFEHGASKS